MHAMPHAAQPMRMPPLQQVSVDIRPEVRNSAVRTLYSVVASHGAHLSAAAWDEALWEILFPLLRTVHQMAATSSREEASYPPVDGMPEHMCSTCGLH